MTVAKWERERMLGNEIVEAAGVGSGWSHIDLSEDFGSRSVLVGKSLDSD